MSMKRILITNDDGIHAPGLLALEESLAPLGDAVVVKEPSGEPIQRTEEMLEAQAKEHPVVPVTGNDVLFEEGEGQAHG